MQEIRINDMSLADRIDYMAHRALMTWTYDQQLRQVVEELNELAVAVCKLSRHKTGEIGINSDKRIDVEKKYSDCVMEEIADVEIMIAQLKRMLGIHKSEIRNYEYQAIVARKLEKLEVEIEEEE